MIEDEAERLKLVMDQLLVSAQLDRDEVTLHREVVEIGELCKSVAGAIEVRKPEAIELAVTAPADVVEVDADGERLRQVVANLLDNAIKYSPGGGRVEVRVGMQGGSGTIEVADQGLGIPALEPQRIFEKFYRLEPSMTRGIGVSGLGVYISRELVRHMGGEIIVDSQLGEGSTFTVLSRSRMSRGCAARRALRWLVRPIQPSTISQPFRQENPPFPAGFLMELAGLEPATSWVRSRRSPN